MLDCCSIIGSATMFRAKVRGSSATTLTDSSSRATSSTIGDRLGGVLADGNLQLERLEARQGRAHEIVAGREAGNGVEAVAAGDPLLAHRRTRSPSPPRRATRSRSRRRPSLRSFRWGWAAAVADNDSTAAAMPSRIRAPVGAFAISTEDPSFAGNCARSARRIGSATVRGGSRDPASADQLEIGELRESRRRARPSRTAPRSARLPGRSPMSRVSAETYIFTNFRPSSRSSPRPKRSA